MNEKAIEKHRTLILRALGGTIPRPKSREEQQATLEALCCHAGLMFALLEGIPYDVPGRPSEMGTAARDGLYKWKEQWDERN